MAMYLRGEECDECDGTGEVYGEAPDCYCCEDCDGPIDDVECPKCEGRGYLREEAEDYIHFGWFAELVRGHQTYVWGEEWHNKHLTIRINPKRISFTNPQGKPRSDDCWVDVPDYVQYTHQHSHFWFQWSFSVNDIKVYDERNFAIGVAFATTGSMSCEIPEEVLKRLLGSIFAAITIQPGDTDDDFFEGYSQAMLAWCKSGTAEDMSGYEELLERLEA